MTPATKPAATPSPELLEAARHGDEVAYGRLISPHRGELHAHCYRMLGSVPDAEDALQEALLRAWRGLPRFEGRSSLRSWLYTIATNTCLRAIERRPRRVLPIDYGPSSDPHDAPGQPLVESVWIDPYPDRELGLTDGLATPEARYEQRESIELAFIAALQHLPVRQRAVLILRDVLGLSAAEVAEVLETTTTSVHSALQRAHKTVDARRPEQSQQAALRALGDARLQRVVDRYVEAWERGDVDAVASMLADDAILAMPPIPNWYAGRAAVAEFLAAWPLAGTRRWRLREIRANGQVAFAHYMSDATTGRFTAHSINVLTLQGERFSSMTAFMEPELFDRFGLAAELTD